MQAAILNLDADFFITPPYYGRFYRDPEAVSYSSYHSISSFWLQPEDFIKKLSLTNRIRGATMKEDNQSYLYIKNMVDKKIVEPNKFTIVNFDAHHDAYVHWDEHWFRSVEGTFHNYDNMIAPFYRNWVAEIVWVTPSYLNKEDIKKQFKNMKVDLTDTSAIIHISPYTKVCLKIVSWDNFIADFDWKYFCFITNPDMSKITPEMITYINKYIARY